MTEAKAPDLYAGWRVERWVTPVSDVPVLDLVRLVDEDGLHVTVEDPRDRRRWRFSFTDAPAYLSLLEEYRLQLWDRGATTEKVGWTIKVPASPWLKQLRHGESLVDVHHPALQHFQIATISTVIDIAAVDEPTVTEELR